ncbi:hypothetical protein, conserved [Babesia bigemina]|uniref:Uncharacterized protein n=1 Tax=Babesia bigemina TaxID=5866 RepID=A0A061BQ61_BABBI|nr:hypothetical protein, conserved [Babesia bigemina]CDR71602.1 hypothetical protein, conserved [Babesia bigemina]|eukprot:XP_012770549.1 hypothetical protein, conserved [Babesia bigemina]
MDSNHIFYALYILSYISNTDHLPASSPHPPSPLNLRTYQSLKQHSPTATLPLPLPVPSTCKRINHTSNALTNCNTYHCRSQSPQPANISITQATHSPTTTLPLPLPVPSTCEHVNHLATHSPTATRTTPPPGPLNLRTYQSPKQHSPTATRTLPLPVPSTCELINHSSNALTNCNTYHCRSQSPQPANMSITHQRTHRLQHVPLPLPFPSSTRTLTPVSPQPRPPTPTLPGIPQLP